MSKKSSTVSVGCKLQVSNGNALHRHHFFTWFLAFNSIQPFIKTSWLLFGGIWLRVKHTYTHTLEQLVLEIKFYNITIYLRDSVSAFLFITQQLSNSLHLYPVLFQFNQVSVICLLFLKCKSQLQALHGRDWLNRHRVYLFLLLFLNLTQQEQNNIVIALRGKLSLKKEHRTYGVSFQCAITLQNTPTGETWVSICPSRTFFLQTGLDEPSITDPPSGFSDQGLISVRCYPTSLFLLGCSGLSAQLEYFYKWLLVLN